MVVRVIDGDTAVLEGGARVRFLGMDAPEMERDGRPK
jgi:endonuclease YncB( thermonuclease family)